MRLLYTIPDFWPFVRRGSERVVHDLGVLLSAAGHDVTVVTRTPGGRATVRREDGFSTSYRATHRRVARRLGWSDTEVFALTAAGASLWRSADLHHAFYLTDAFGAAMAGRLRRRPLVVSLHGVPGRDWWERNHPRTYRWFCRTLELSPCVTVMSADSAAQLREHYGYEAVVVTPGVFVSEYRRPRAAEGRVIICAAAVDDGRKRIHDVLLPAFELLAGEDRSVTLLLAGFGDPEYCLRPALRSLRPETAARVVHEPATDLAAAYARSSVGVLTSTVEAFGLVVIEYLAAGLPAVVSDSVAAADALTPATGAVFPEGDIEACARAMAAALKLSDDQRTERLCREAAEPFDWPRRLPAYTDLYESVAR